MYNPRNPNKQYRGLEVFVCRIFGVDRYLSRGTLLGIPSLGFEMGPVTSPGRAKRISLLDLEVMWRELERDGTAAERCNYLMSEGYFAEES